jgi:hypothetical protein
LCNYLVFLIFLQAIEIKRFFINHWNPMDCNEKKLSKTLTQIFMAYCNVMIYQQAALSGDAERPKVADAVIEAQQRTLTDILLQALVFAWEHAHDAAELGLVRKQLATLEEQYKALTKRHEIIVKRHATAKADLATVRRARDKAERELAALRDHYRRCTLYGIWPDHDTAEELRWRLKKLCHPDRWSQGQPASELAHELMVVLNK